MKTNGTLLTLVLASAGAACATSQGASTATPVRLGADVTCAQGAFTSSCDGNEDATLVLSSQPQSYVEVDVPLGTTQVRVDVRGVVRWELDELDVNGVRAPLDKGLVRGDGAAYTIAVPRAMRGGRRVLKIVAGDLGEAAQVASVDLVLPTEALALRGVGAGE